MASYEGYRPRYGEGRYYQPSRPLSDIINKAIRDFIPPTLVNSLMQKWTEISQPAWEYFSLPMDIVEVGDKYVITVDVPGFDKNSLFVHIENGNALVIRGQRPEEPNLGTTIMKGRPTRIEKRIPLPMNLIKDVPPEELKPKIRAQYDNNRSVLTVTIERPNSYKIEIE